MPGARSLHSAILCSHGIVHLMPASRPRPLTWLFLLATLVIDVAVLLLGLGERPLSYLVIGFVIGQMFWVGSWLVAGDAHRLARGATFVIAAMGLTTVVEYSNHGGPGDWGRTFGAVAVLASASAASTAVVLIILRRWDDLRGHRARADYRFPLIELFGWTIVVALASVALRWARFGQLLSQAAQFAHAIAIAATSGLIYALFLSREAKASLARCVVVAAAIVAVVAAGTSSRVGADRDLYYGFFWSCTYLACLIIVDRLDRGMRAPPSSELPQVGLLNLPVDDDPVAGD